jgi:hypothetical protein
VAADIERRAAARIFHARVLSLLRLLHSYNNTCAPFAIFSNHYRT